ncbi:MAG TPA: polysaccharide pyruvyl transferase family protein [Thermoanaerobaculia bacterium]|nr:polysaccharide pyruvyl transferase family protein [Thermoanaerobaculia bacterium]
MRRTALLAGYYGFGNTGDEAILAALLTGLTRRRPDDRFVVLSGDPDDTRRRHGVAAVPWRDVEALAAEVAQADLVVLGGGGLFQDYWGFDPETLLTVRSGGISYYAGPAALAALSRRPLRLHALGFGPIASAPARRVTRAVCAAASAITVRDAESRDLLASLGVDVAGVAVTADAAFALSAPRIEPRELLAASGVAPSGPVLGVSLRPWSLGVDHEVWERATAAALDLFLDRTGGAALFLPFERSPWSREDDTEVSLRVRRRMRRADRAAVLTEPRPPEEAAGLLAGCDAVLGMRLHALNLAVAAGVPVVGIAYDPKVTALLARLGLAEMGVAPAEANAGGLLDRLTRALDGRAATAARLKDEAARMRRLAEEDLDAAARMLADPPSPPAIGDELVSLFADSVRGHIAAGASAARETERQAREIATLETRSADLQSRAAQLDGQLQSETRRLEGIIAALRSEYRALDEKFVAHHEAHAKDKAFLEQLLAESRAELYKIYTGRVWRAANLFWRGRRGLAGAAKKALRPLIGKPASDWAGPDPSAAAAKHAGPMADESRHGFLWLRGGGDPAANAVADGAIARLGAAGHRVAAVAPGAADLDARLRDPGLGACAIVVEAGADLAGARRLGRERGFPVVSLNDTRKDVVSLNDARKDAGFGRAAAAGDAADVTVELADFDDARLPATLSRIAAAFPKVSIVLVTYGRADLTRLCLESLFARTEWPNLEVIVVDNASPDGTGDLLEALARTEPRLKVIRNAENRGFAAATNAGLAVATGDYLVPLNNDTVLTHGWVTALIRHLASDPSLGLVGPVTNAIANAAQVEVGYRGLDDLSRWAAEWTRAHDGETFEMPMLAFFCLAMRRSTFERVGALDERFGVGMFEDDDYSRRVKREGLAVRAARDAFVHHWKMASFRRLGKERYFALYEENRRRFEEKWGAAPEAPARPEAATPGIPDRHRAQQREVLARIAKKRGAVIFLPSVGWGIHLFQRPHHLARVLARLGWVAIFDSSNAPYDRVDGFKEIEPDLFLFSGDAALLHDVPSPVLWAFPYNYHLAAAYPQGARVVYDWIDDLDVFPQDRALLERNHDAALAGATVVASVARKLHEQAVAARPDAVYLPNGVEYERFAGSAAPPRDEDLSRFLTPGAPVIGYYGALAEWFDYPLLDAVAARRPDWRFVLIGPQYDESLPGQPLLERHNVRWFGPRDYVTLPGYLSLFDVATIPFRINPITLATSPLKLFEYFAGGKPVVTTPMPECEAFSEVLIADNADDFLRQLERSRERGRDPAFRSRLREIGRVNSWESRARRALEALGEPAEASHEASARPPVPART